MSVDLLGRCLAIVYLSTEILFSKQIKQIKSILIDDHIRCLHGCVASMRLRFVTAFEDYVCIFQWGFAAWVVVIYYPAHVVPGWFECP